MAAAFDCPIICPDGQKHIFENKMHNLGLAVSRMQGLVLRPGEIFSFWRLVGKPTEANGYREGATFLSGKVSSAVGGGLCQLSGLIHNLALLAGCPILERHGHSIDAYGEGRYIPLGRDATVTYPRADLCFRNPHPFPLVLKLEVTRQKAQGWFHSPQPLPYEVAIEVEALETYPSPVLVEGEREEQGFAGSRVFTKRVFTTPGKPTLSEGLGESRYQATPTFMPMTPVKGK